MILGSILVDSVRTLEDALKDALNRQETLRERAAMTTEALQDVAKKIEGLLHALTVLWKESNEV
jgi:hypothetical protein